MATAPRQQIASPQSFTSDPLEREFGKVMVTDPVMGGLAGANYLLSGYAREQGEQQYLKNLQQSNYLAAQLARQDMQADLTKTALEKGPDYMREGANPSDIPLVGQFFTGNSGNEASGLRRSLLQAQVNELNAKAAASAQGGQPTVEYQVVNDANGTPVVTTTVKGKGSDINTVATMGERANTRVTAGRADPTMPAVPSAPFQSRTLGQVDQTSRDAWMRANPGRPFPGTPPITGR